MSLEWGLGCRSFYCWCRTYIDCFIQSSVFGDFSKHLDLLFFLLGSNTLKHSVGLGCRENSEADRKSKNNIWKDPVDRSGCKISKCSNRWSFIPTGFNTTCKETLMNWWEEYTLLENASKTGETGRLWQGMYLLSWDSVDPERDSACCSIIFHKTCSICSGEDKTYIRHHYDIIMTYWFIRLL